jgi:NAD(P)-dependent dehydrogenase (short-subunit alcohol dehydrogenase family)
VRIMATQKVVLVTGVTSGIGEATAKVLSSQGYRVFGTARRSGGSRTLPAIAELVSLDVTDEASVRSCVQTVVDQSGRIDALVNNAGYTLIGSLEETSIEEAKELFETNFFGALRMTQAVLPIMREQRSGRIINISSVAAFLPNPYMGIYAASKRAMEGCSVTLDHEVRQFGIRVSTIEPGFTRTNLGRHARLARQSLRDYATSQNRALDAIYRSIEEGEDPLRIALVVANALADRQQHLRYLAGRSARFLSRLQKWAPSGLLDKGLRRQFGLKSEVDPPLSAAGTRDA